MKIAFVLPSLANKGPVIVVYNLIKILLNDKRVSLIVFYFNDVENPLKFECEVSKINFNKKIDFSKYDIIHSHTLRSDFYLFRFRKHISSAKIVTTIHQDSFHTLRTRYNIFISKALTYSWIYLQTRFDAIIAISGEINLKYNKYFTPKLHTIYNGCFVDNHIIDTTFKDIILNLRSDGFKVLCSYCTITKDKGLQQVIKALKSLPDYVFLIIGEGPYLNHLKQFTLDERLENRVLFFPYIHVPYSYLQFIDLYMMTSYSEGFGLSMVEAALEKKSIVCSNIPIFKELFTKDEVTFFELDQTNDLVTSIQHGYKMKKEKGILAFDKASTYYTANSMAENHLSLYYKILNN